MPRNKWNYCGDINLTQGGWFWREDGAEDYVCAVRVTPCSDAGGPENLFDIEVGSIYLPKDEKDRKRALSVIGEENNPAPSRAMIVEAFLSCHGMERDCMNGETIVRVGPVDPFYSDKRCDGWNPKPDRILRSNASLERFVKREFLD